jgi:hypothetical protein
MAIAQPRPLWPEKPLDNSRELEHLVVRWKNIKSGWAINRLSNPIPRQRHFFISDESAPRFSSCVYLVEGGRWLLIGTKSGSVQYYDLDAATISPSTLIPSPFDGRAEIWISVDMDSAAESLGLHLATLTRRTDISNTENTDSCWIHVWRITTEVDSHGYVKGLTPELLSSFREESKSTVLSFRLQGEHVAYSLFFSHLYVPPPNNGHKIIVVNWVTCHSTGLSYSRKLSLVLKQV